MCDDVSRINKSCFADGTSYYQESLHELIAAYKEKVGAKVVLAGCSNGGYMTLLMGLAYPQNMMQLCLFVKQFLILILLMNNYKVLKIYQCISFIQKMMIQ